MPSAKAVFCHLLLPALLFAAVEGFSQATNRYA